MKNYDVAVIGGGPIGGFVAGKIAEKRFSVIVIEKNKKIGLPVNCAGLVTQRVFELTNLPKKGIVQNEIKGANIHSPSNKILTIGGDKVHALSIDRERFDQEIIKKSEKKGADILIENKVLSMKNVNKTFKLKTSEQKELSCKILIGADGPYSKTREMLSLPTPKEYLKGIGAEVSDVNLNPDYVEIFVGKKIAPGFFAWIIPTNKKGTTGRIGLCVNQKSIKSPKHYFSKFFKNDIYEEYLKGCTVEKNIGGVIPLGTLKKTYSDNAILVGDAAAQVKPTSGGGIYPGLVCGMHCSNTAVESLQKKDHSGNLLKKYQKLWEKDIGYELKRGMKFRNIYSNLSDKKLDKYIVKLQNPKIIEIINKHGDIDYPSKLFKPLIKKIPYLI